MSGEPSKQKTTTEENLKGHCNAFCPQCGSDLYFYNNACYCKNPKCDWSCGGCEKYGTRQE